MRDEAVGTVETSFSVLRRVSRKLQDNEGKTDGNCRSFESLAPSKMARQLDRVLVETTFSSATIHDLVPSPRESIHGHLVSMTSSSSYASDEGNGSGVMVVIATESGIDFDESRFDCRTEMNRVSSLIDGADPSGRLYDRSETFYDHEYPSHRGGSDHDVSLYDRASDEGSEIVQKRENPKESDVDVDWENDCADDCADDLDFGLVEECRGCAEEDRERLE